MVSSAPSRHINNTYIYHGVWLFWLLLNLFQAYFTELIHDEAYYYFYSTHPARGYYDHPPMLAWLIKAGTSISLNELGVRLLVVLSSAASLLLFMKLAEVKDHLLFFIVWFSVLIVQVGGFIAVPDVPLIFFSALFFLAYRNYIEKDNLRNSIWVAVAIAAMFYAKYTGFLVVFFTVLSKPGLIRRKSFWIIVAATTMLMIPYLIWEIQHDFVTVYYHSVARAIGYHFSWNNITNYVLGQIGIMNPLMAFILLYFGVTYKPRDVLEKALKYNAIGVLFVGLILSFRGPVEANWTSSAIIPLIIVAYKGFSTKRNVVKAVYAVGILSAVLIFVMRSLLMENYLPAKYKHHIKAEFYDWDSWAESIHGIAGEKPVVFINSYQKASKYYYYGTENSFTYNSVKYRRNQFDLEGIEQHLFNKEVVLFNKDKNIWMMNGLTFPIPYTDSIETAAVGRMYYCIVPHYRTYNFLNIEYNVPEEHVKPGSLIDIPVKIINPFDQPFTIPQDSLGTYIAAVFYKWGEVISYQEIEDLSGRTIPHEYEMHLKTGVPGEKGVYYMRVVIRPGWLPPGLNSRVQKMIVE